MTDTDKTLSDETSRYWRMANLTTGALLLGFCLLQLAASELEGTSLGATVQSAAGASR